MLEHCCGSFWQTGTPHTGLLPPSMCSLQDSGVINTFTHKTTVIPAFLQGSEVPCVTKLSNSSLAASSTPGSALFIKGRPTSAFAVVRFFIFQRALLLPSGFMFHHKETSKAEEEFQPSFLCADWRNPDLCVCSQHLLSP